MLNSVVIGAKFNGGRGHNSNLAPLDAKFMNLWIQESGLYEFQRPAKR